MLTKTTEAGIQILLFLAASETDAPMSPRALAGRLRLSPSYLAKVAGHLVRADILRARRGVKGGVTLSRAPAAIRLLDVVQALQGVILGDYCASPGAVRACGFHQAMVELHESTVAILSRWTLADLAAVPASCANGSTCRMTAVAGALRDARAAMAKPAAKTTAGRRAVG